MSESITLAASIEKIKNFIHSLADKTAKIAVFGAGRIGADIQKECLNNGIEVSYFIDNSPQKHGIDFNGVPVISVEQLKELCAKENIGIFIAAIYADGITAQLMKEGLEQKIIATETEMKEMKLNIFSNFNQKISCDDAPYPLKPYHYDFINRAGEQGGIKFRGKRVLEIGGSNYPADILFKQLGVKKWVCVDHIDWWRTKTPNALSSQVVPQILDKTKKFLIADIKDGASALDNHRYMKFHGDASQIPHEWNGYFDIVVSVAAFEHIHPLPEVVDSIYRCLKSGGRFYSFFGPIWSGPCGNHYWINDAVNFTTMSSDKIPDYAHLIWTEEEMRQNLEQLNLPLGSKQIDAICDWSFRNDKITRRFYNDYENIMKSSDFSDYALIPNYWGGGEGKPSDEISAILEKKYPNNTIWANGITITARK